MKNKHGLSLLFITTGAVLLSGCNPVIYDYSGSQPPSSQTPKVVVVNPKRTVPDNSTRPHQEQIDAAKQAAQQKQNTNKPLPPADDTTKSHPAAQKAKDHHAAKNGDDSNNQ